MTQTHKWNMADTITATRMAATVFLLFLPLNSVAFFAAYTLTGLTDVLDGWIARKTGKTSQFGARLDSAADLMFYAVLLLRLFPPVWQIDLVYGDGHPDGAADILRRCGNSVSLLCRPAHLAEQTDWRRCIPAALCANDASQ